MLHERLKRQLGVKYDHEVAEDTFGVTSLLLESFVCLALSRHKADDGPGEKSTLTAL